MWQPYKDYPVSDWYPGDDYVDWVAVSMFGQAYRDDDFGPYSTPILDFAKQHKKPVMIAEASAVYGIKKDNNEAWNTWFVKFFTFAYSKNIRAISFINEDWTTFKVDGISSWRDACLYNNDSISKAWFMETNKELYLKQSPELFELLGYKKDIKN
jgi:beta-mannanase